jgi:bacterioferritin
MGLKPLDTNKACAILNEIMEYELAGVVRYTHSAMMVTGPYRIPIVAFLKEQASESLLHAQGAGELIAGLDGHTIKDILEESLEHELHAVSLYKKLLEEVEDSSIYLEEYARGMIGEEEQHSLELKRMLKDYG